ncbi:bifunctional 2-polyprenyl-6-hydroxyphenol methylase/3-demethylubiquinol 3-O-methyltransferase UbiG [Paenibacillus sp. Y412MC10]|uniref:class I SAM-dependent methyltransferase n=1 Tax=Geobacillus sp. (strain Y412MC10) TaxID=481743 RepID=UPI00164310CB|nr:class I SAM-dependent methyltransferase [Paenibacillus sp. Y412MC10]
MKFIERLEFGEKTEYSPLESSIHLGRYLLTKQYCKDKRVLDIACGEGYGSFAMAEHWGAKEVYGVDISDEAIDKAKASFQTKNVHFEKMNAAEDGDRFEDEYFDLIVSFETIEHLPNPEMYLRNLKKWIKPNGIIIISCPNDNWYYSEPDQSNPFHEKKYTFNEFSRLCTGILGDPRGYMYGMPISGFANVSKNDSLLQFPVKLNNMNNMFNFKQADNVMLPTAYEINESNVSYFVGIWGPEEIGITTTACFYGASMEESRVVSFTDYINLKEKTTSHDADVYHLNQTIEELHTKIREMAKQKSALIAQNKKLSLAVKGTNLENGFLKSHLLAIQNWSNGLTKNEREKELEDEINSLLNSKSWRITAPLRKIMGWFRQ